MVTLSIELTSPVQEKVTGILWAKQNEGNEISARKRFFDNMA
jgi:hypothetical protein